MSSSSPPAPPHSPPPHNNRIQIVHSFAELIRTPFAEGINALCWPRVLIGDFAEVIEKLAPGPGITPVDLTHLEKLAPTLSAAGQAAIAVLLEDQRLLQDHDLQPSLDCVNGYLSEEETGPVRTDVCSFHVDSATAEADTYLCTYHGASSEGLRNEDAIRRVDVPETRTALLQLHDGADDETFAEYLNDHCYDLHYIPTSPQAQPYTFGLGNLWRIATQYPGSPVPPCIHRAPDPVAGSVRLLLIS